MVVGLCVDHQAEAVAVPTCAVRPFDYLGAGSTEGVEVNLSENSYISCTRGLSHIREAVIYVLAEFVR